MKAVKNGELRLDGGKIRAVWKDELRFKDPDAKSNGKSTGRRREEHEENEPPPKEKKEKSSYRNAFVDTESRKIRDVRRSRKIDKRGYFAERGGDNDSDEDEWKRLSQEWKE